MLIRPQELRTCKKKIDLNIFVELVYNDHAKFVHLQLLIPTMAEEQELPSSTNKFQKGHEIDWDQLYKK